MCKLKLLLIYNTISFSDMYLLAYFILKLEKTEEFIKTMDNPETLATLDTQDTERRQTKQNKTKTQKNKMTSTTKLPGLNNHRHHQTTGGEQHGHHQTTGGEQSQTAPDYRG
jgi:replication initiation and membrane attachment protein DnaB